MVGPNNASSFCDNLRKTHTVHMISNSSTDATSDSQISPTYKLTVGTSGNVFGMRCMLFLSPIQQCQSTEGNLKHWLQSIWTHSIFICCWTSDGRQRTLAPESKLMAENGEMQSIQHGLKT